MVRRRKQIQKQMIMNDSILKEGKITASLVRYDLARDDIAMSFEKSRVEKFYRVFNT